MMVPVELNCVYRRLQIIWCTQDKWTIRRTSEVQPKGFRVGVHLQVGLLHPALNVHGTVYDAVVVQHLLACHPKLLICLYRTEAQCKLE